MCAISRPYHKTSARVHGGNPHSALVRSHTPGDRIGGRRRILVECSESQAELADKMGITQPGVAQIEKEGAKPQLRTLEKAAQALGVQIEQLTD